MRLTTILTVLCLFFLSNLSSQDLHFKNKPLPCVDRTIKLAAHIVQHGNGSLGIYTDSIRSQINFLNKMFSPICVNFELVGPILIENFQYNSLEIQARVDELNVLYPSSTIINTFFVNNFSHVNDINGHAEIGSFGTPKGSIVLKKLPFDYKNPSTWAHQLGHLFGLINTYEGNGTELVNGSNCTSAGDLICDTPADNYNPNASITSFIGTTGDFTCRVLNNFTDYNGEFYCPDVGNIMSNYARYDGIQPVVECRCGFTADQYRQMAEFIQSTLGM